MFGSVFIIGWKPYVTGCFCWGAWLCPPNMSKPKLLFPWGWETWAGGGWFWLFIGNPPWFATGAFCWGAENPNPIKSIPPPVFKEGWFTGGCGGGVGWGCGDGDPNPKRSPPKPELLGWLFGWGGWRGCVGWEDPVLKPIKSNWFDGGAGWVGCGAGLGSKLKRSSEVGGDFFSTTGCVGWEGCDG